MFQDGMKMSGKLTISLNDKVVQEVDNLVVTSGKEFVASRMVGSSSDVMSHMAIGSGSTAAAAGDTALGSELGRVSSADSVSGAVVTYSATFGAGTGTGAVTEAGLFNAASGGDMLCRTVFSVVNKGASDSMTISWAVTVS
jgi:ethanolamine utilization microcompartment shell protein EutS